MGGIFVEDVSQRFCGHVLVSSVRPATDEEVRIARDEFLSTGKCKCNLVVDHAGWMYTTRSCAICGAGLGAL